MNPHRWPRTRCRRLVRSETGFTLIELLVVITILGVLAAIVVFAVNGIGDKGRTNAVAEDARTLRTAEEAYCAQHGKYTDKPGLVAAKLLVSEQSYNSIVPGAGGDCGSGAFSSFSLNDATAPTEITTEAIDVGAGPADVAVDPKTNMVYVANAADDSVSVIDGDTDTVVGSPIHVGASPQNITVNPAKNKIYVANANDLTVSVIDGTTQTVVKSLDFPDDQPGEITVNPTNDEVYVAPLNGGHAGVMVINGSTNDGTDLPLPVAPFQVAVDPDTNKVYFGAGDNRLYAFGGDSHDVTSHVIGPDDIHTNGYVAVDPVANRIFVTATVTLPQCQGSPPPSPCDDTAHPMRTRTIVVDGSDFSFTPVLEPAFFPAESRVVVNPGTGAMYAFADDLGLSRLMKFDPAPAQNKYVAQAQVSQVDVIDTLTFSHLMVLNPSTNRLYFPQRYSPPFNLDGGLVAFDADTMLPTPGSPLGGGRQFVSIAVNRETGKIYAVDHSGNSVAVLR
jgi:prepilin-type N-terminal cleavage/methylation domain-containing protein